MNTLTTPRQARISNRK